MRIKLYKIALFITSILLVFALTSCADDDEGKKPTGESLTLYVYNWGEYISDGFEGSLDSNKAFEDYYFEKYGVRVNVIYTTYATNEDMYSKLQGGAGTYDIIIPSDYMIQKMIEEDMLLPFDAETIPNYENISNEFKGLYYDINNMYSVPYTYGMMGIIYNTQFVDPVDVGSWSLLWNEKYKGKILQFNNPRDAFGSAMYYMGLDVNSNDPLVWTAARDKLVLQKPLVQGYVNDEIFNKMTTASAAVAPYFAGDFITMSEQNEDLAFYYPNEGTNVFVDAMCIPKNARNPELAKEYINFMLTEEVAVANAIYIGYASPNKLVANNGVYNESYLEEMGEEALHILYGANPEELNREYNEKYGTTSYKSFSPEIQSHVNILWESLKTENSTELWVHISCGIIVGAVVSLAVYSTYTKKKRSRHYRMRAKLARLAEK